MAKKMHAGLQTDAVTITLPTAEEREREKNGRYLKAWLEARGERWHKLPFYHRDVDAEGGSFYVGPRCRLGHEGYGLGGAVRRTSHHGCLECQLFR